MLAAVVGVQERHPLCDDRNVILHPILPASMNPHHRYSPFRLSYGNGTGHAKTGIFSVHCAGQCWKKSMDWRKKNVRAQEGQLGGGGM